jgi:Protein of unknown function (DUF3105)
MMSISSQGGQQRRPSVVATGKKAPPADKSPADEPAESSSGADAKAESTAKPAGSKTTPKTAARTGAAAKTTPKTAARTGAAAKAGAKSGTGARPATGARPGAGAKGGKGGGPRRPVTPVKVSQGRNWGPIALFTVVGLLAAGIIGWGGWAVYQNGRSWEDKANSISGIVDYRKTDPNMLSRNHKAGTLSYKTTPPVGGDHNPTWERCMGDVYDTQIPSENAVHSLEHGAVWITYRPDLAKDQVDKLASKVRGKDFLLMSPFPGLDKPISLQAWGYQLKLDSANDGRIDDFISALRENASLEPGTPCSSGNYTTGTGTTPRDLSSQTDGGTGTGG